MNQAVKKQNVLWFHGKLVKLSAQKSLLISRKIREFGREKTKIYLFSRKFREIVCTKKASLLISQKIRELGHEKVKLVGFTENS